MLLKAWVALDDLDDVTNEANQAVLEPLDRFCIHRIKELEVAVSYARAASPLGMLTQIAVAFDALDEAVTGSEQLIREAARNRAGRCLHSAFAALCTLMDIEREGLCANRYMPVKADDLAFLSPEVVG